MAGRSMARVGFGAMQLARCADHRSDAVKLLHHAIDLGVDHIDTAAFYGHGFVNGVIGEVLRATPDILVATKVGATSNPGGTTPLRPAQRPEDIRVEVEANLRSLGVERLDLVNMRRLDVAPGLLAEGDQIVDIDDQLAELIAMRNEGKIGAIGLSAVDIDTLTQAVPAGIACVQNAYSLLSRRYEDMLLLCCAHDIAWVPFFPLGGAFLAEWPKVTQHDKIIEIAARLGALPSQIGLAWLLAHRSNILLIPGTATHAHLEENVAAASVQLDPTTLAELDALGMPSL